LDNSKKIIFVTGLSRSGTKLLRDLCNNHPEINIPEVETLFIPQLIQKFDNVDLNNSNHIEEVEGFIKETSFFWYYKANESEFSLDKIVRKTNINSLSDLIIELLDFFGPKDENKCEFVGDKSPGYLLHVDLFISKWPSTKFVHIIRDPRDYALSHKKAWGKNIYRAASYWNKSMLLVEKYKKEGVLTESNYHELYYEKLLENPVDSLKQICNFLGLVYYPEMEILRNQVENLGDAKGEIRIVSENRNKFLESLKGNRLKKLESLIKHSAEIHGYELVTNVSQSQLGTIEEVIYKLFDGFNSVKFHIKEKGLIEGISFFLKLHRGHSVKNKIKVEQ
jgi:hypothetical protein